MTEPEKEDRFHVTEASEPRMNHHDFTHTYLAYWDLTNKKCLDTQKMQILNWDNICCGYPSMISPIQKQSFGQEMWDFFATWILEEFPSDAPVVESWQIRRIYPEAYN